MGVGGIRVSGPLVAGADQVRELVQEGEVAVSGRHWAEADLFLKKLRGDSLEARDVEKAGDQDGIHVGVAEVLGAVGEAAAVERIKSYGALEC